LFEAKKRYGLCVLNYIVTSNHIHLLVLDAGQDAIPKSMQLIAGRTAQEYNKRKNRKGAFWEDRYHATAVQTDDHLVRCMTYIDLNMVRAGVVQHPSDWKESGFCELQNPPQRYSIIDLERLMQLLGFHSLMKMQQTYSSWVESLLNSGENKRNGCWTESIAVGSEDYAQRVKNDLGVRAKSREVLPEDDAYMLKEPRVPYQAHSGNEMSNLSDLNGIYLEDI
jgi:REP element-mobilizing transposase RayT